jgi:hypothetical protein
MSPPRIRLPLGLSDFRALRQDGYRYVDKTALVEAVVVHRRPAIRKVTAVLDDDRDTRPYLKSLRKAVEASSIGTSEQRDAFLEDR